MYNLEHSTTVTKKATKGVLVECIHYCNPQMLYGSIIMFYEPSKDIYIRLSQIRYILGYPLIDIAATI